MDKITELLTRGVDKIYPSREELEKVLRSGKKLKLYQGFDPTGTVLHIGHMVGLRKLRQWQDLGHEVIFLIGDGTGQAGDPSGRTRAREKFLTRDELRQNAKEYVMQASKIVRFEDKNPVKILYNSEWLNKLGLVEILGIIGHFSLQQLSERDLFQERIKKNEAVNLREFFYPLLQGYDSVAMDVDLEIGGSDQTFNMLIGRQLLKAMKNKDKFVMTTPLLTDAAGNKIGKSEGNVIGLTDSPGDLFGKLMGLSDDVIVKGFEYLTDVSMDEVAEIQQKLKGGANPIEFKKRLAFEIVRELNSGDDAKRAQEHFEKTVQKKELPEDISVFEMKPDEHLNITELLVKAGLASSRSEAKRLVEQGAVEVDSDVVDSPTEEIIPEDNILIKAGKRNFIRIKLSSTK